MKEFLRSVAEHYHREAISTEGALALSDYLFVFPNRRSGLFFSHYLGALSETPVAAPATTTINELFARLSNELRLADRMELLFRLYGLYQSLSHTTEEFDNFVFWGDMLLSDFDDIDKYEVDAQRLFHNVRDLKEIELLYTDYDPETVAVIRSFWTHFFPNDHDHKKELFEQTWAILYDLYAGFRRSLESDGLAYEGMLMRRVIERLASPDFDDDAWATLIPYRKVVFVGLTAVSRVDRHLMLRLKMRGMADFCWDYADPRLTDPASRAAFFTADNLADFPNALNEAELRAGIVPDAQKEVHLIAVPSGVGQTVQAADVLRKWIADGIIQPSERDKEASGNAIHTAVVLPDEKLLIPMLYAVPETLEPFNVTMGYPLKATPVAGLMDDIIRLQTDTWRDGRDGGEATFYFKPVQALLSHSYINAMCPHTAARILEHITRESLFRVPISLFAQEPLLATLFRRVRDAADAAVYLHTLLGLLLQQAEHDARLEEESEPSLIPEQPVFSSVEREFLYCYAQAVDRLAELMGRFSYRFKVTTFFHLLQRLTQGEMVPFSGEPLAGLQVMGVLETRSVDFDNVILLSMNEGVFPAKATPNTFIPMSLRSAFGLPTQKHRDAVFAYHFYRLCARARRIVYLYDTRSGGTQTGEVSRYLLQLKHLYHQPMQQHPVHYNLSTQESASFVVQKDARVQQLLDRYRPGGDLFLSASALKDFCACPFRFYLIYLEGLREEDEVAEGIDSSQFGSVFHEAMSRLYAPLCGRRVTSDYLKALIKNRREIREAVEASFDHVMHVAHPEGYLGLVSEIIQEYVRNVLTHDASLCPFTYLASEYKQRSVYTLNDDRAVQLTCIYDRLDIDREGHLRIIDYKTSRPKVKNTQPKTQFNSVAGLFDPENDGCSDEAMQVMMYCLMFGLASDEELCQLTLNTSDAPRYHGLVPHLYSVREFHEEQVATGLTFLPNNRYTPEDEMQLPSGALSDYAPFAATFEREFRRTLEALFDPRQPFSQCADTKGCTYCPFVALCKRG
jgi:hypothetical protein